MRPKESGYEKIEINPALVVIGACGMRRFAFPASSSASATTARPASPLAAFGATAFVSRFFKAIARLGEDGNPGHFHAASFNF
jgi:hypothetical protein